MYRRSLILLLVYVLQNIRFSWSVNKNDFYDYTNAVAFEKQHVVLESTVPYPFWSDPANKRVGLATSGIARLSGFDGTNTLDALVYATKLPMSVENIRYEQIAAPSAKLNSALIRDLAGLAPSGFIASHVTIASWINVPFMPDRLSSFQIIFATDSNTTYILMLIDAISHLESLPYFPEIDIRYAYEDGTKYIRSNFLQTVTGVSTRTKEAAIAAIENSNCKKAGRWCFRATDSPIVIDSTITTAAPVVTPVSPDVKNSSNIGIKGAFTFTSLGLDGNTITDGKNNDELSILLTKKDADQRYGVLNKNMRDYIGKVYREASGTDVTTTIIGYRMGSLIVEYSVSSNSSLCNGTTGQECIQSVKEKVKNKVSNSTVQSGALSGILDTKKIVVEDFDECSTGTSCDFNAICFDYPNLLTFGCKCKDEYIGDGFPGNCKPRYASFHYTSIVMYIVIVVVVLSVAFVTVVFYKVYKNDEETKELEEHRYSGSQPLGWHTRYPYGYRYDGDPYRRRFPDDD